MHSDFTHLFAGAMLVVSLAFCFAALIAVIFYLLTLQKCLNRIAPANRAMQPPMVWLNLIPLFGVIWNFVTVLKVSESVVKEGQTRGIAVADGGKTLGLASAILGVCGIIPLLGIPCVIGGLVCWIMYWVKISGYSALFAAPLPAPAAVV